MKLLVGERADSSCVREGAKNAEVRGRLFPSDPTAEELVAVRKVSADGRSRATINGAMDIEEALERAEELYISAADRTFRMLKAGMSLGRK